MRMRYVLNAADTVSIIPWNIPALMFGMKVAPALAAGCTCVLKSSEKAPLTVSAIERIENFDRLLTGRPARKTGTART